VIKIKTGTKQEFLLGIANEKFDAKNIKAKDPNFYGVYLKNENAICTCNIPEPIMNNKQNTFG